MDLNKLKAANDLQALATTTEEDFLFIVGAIENRIIQLEYEFDNL